MHSGCWDVNHDSDDWSMWRYFIPICLLISGCFWKILLYFSLSPQLIGECISIPVSGSHWRSAIMILSSWCMFFIWLQPSWKCYQVCRGSAYSNGLPLHSGVYYYFVDFSVKYNGYSTWCWSGFSFGLSVCSELSTSKEKFNQAMAEYALSDGSRLIGGIFPGSQLAFCPSTRCIYNAMQEGLHINCSKVFMTTIHTHGTTLREMMNYKIKPCSSLCDFCCIVFPKTSQLRKLPSLSQVRRFPIPQLLMFMLQLWLLL